MTITGTVHHVGQVEVISEKFSKRLLVIKTDGEYNNLCPIEFTKDKGALLDGLQIGQSVSVEINLGGREYNGKYYASVTGWKIAVGEKLSSKEWLMQPAVVASKPQTVVNEPGDDLPF